MKVHETIIVGGGIAGLGCARTLSNADKNFLLVSEDIGGRITLSKDRRVNYGAYFISKSYKNTRPFFKKKKKIRIFDLAFHEKERSSTMTGVLAHPFELGRIILLLLSFRKHYRKFKKESARTGQKNALESDVFLNRLYHTRASDLFQEINVEKLAKKYMNPAIYGILFLRAEELYAFEYLRWAQYLLENIYDFEFLDKKIIEGFEKRIEFDSIKKIQKKNGFFELEGRKKYRCKNLVVATPPHISKKLLNLKSIKGPANAHMFHLHGVLKQKWQKARNNVFAEGSHLLDISNEQDGSILLYTKEEKPDFKKYFEEYTLIAKREWNPAFNMNGDVIWPCEIDENLFLIGDHNVCGMEDAYITGLFAANKIIERGNDARPPISPQ